MNSGLNCTILLTNVKGTTIIVYYLHSGKGLAVVQVCK